MAVLDFSQVGKTFTGEKNANHFTVFEDINLHVHNGEFVALLGPSGCGKSTLLNIVAGLDKVSTGSVSVDGAAVTAPGPDRGVVFQEAALMPWLSVLDNVTFGLRKHMGKEEAAKEAKKYLKLVHLTRFLHSFPHELSGGMKQRVAIARALSINPDILLMDEPFGALDEQTRMMLHREVQYIWTETQKTILFVTHNIREAILLADRIVLMGTRPGGIRDIYPVNLSRPRDPASKDFISLEKTIMNSLAVEIEKVMKEEMGDDFTSQKGALLYSSDPHLGDHI